MLRKYKLSPSEQLGIDGEKIWSSENEYISVNVPIIGHKGKKYSAYMALFFYDKDNNVISRRIKWIDNFQSMEKIYKIITKTDSKTNGVVFGFRINTNGTSPSEVDIELPNPNEVKLEKLKTSKQIFDDLYPSERLWEEANLEKNYWKIVGPNSKDDFDSQANKMFNLLKKMGVNPKSRILDIGCGTGKTTSKLINYLSDDGYYYGTDIASQAIEFCKKHYNRKNFKFLQNDFEKIPIKTKKFDFIFFFSVFTHIYPEEILTYLKECQRLLDENGVIFADILISSKTKDHSGDRGRLLYNELFFKTLVEKSNLKASVVVEDALDFRKFYKIKSQ